MFRTLCGHLCATTAPLSTTGYSNALDLSPSTNPLLRGFNEDGRTQSAKSQRRNAARVRQCRWTETSCVAIGLPYSMDLTDRIGSHMPENTSGGVPFARHDKMDQRNALAREF